MSRQTGRQHETVEDALARQVEHRRGPASRLAEALRELGQVDRAVYQAVGRHLPGLAAPLRLLASGVAYSRVHTGVHYPGDVVAGSILGAGGAAMVAAAFDRLPRRSRR
jgi:membrane-associated phospholipid phosphatase